MPKGKVSIGDSTTMDYGAIIEFGSGKGFNQGASHLNRYFPIPERIKSLKASSRNRRAVNSKTGKGRVCVAPVRKRINRIIKRMKKASRIMVTGYNNEGSQTIDHYSLMGFTKAEVPTSV